MMKTIIISFVISISSIAISFANESVVHVSPDGTGDGSTWANAASFADAVNIVTGSEVKPQLWLKSGTYHFTAPVDFDHLLIYGGFKGDETLLEQRDWAANPTIFDGGGTSSILRNTVGPDRNSTTVPSLLDGVIVQNGYLTQTNTHGGAMLINRGALIRNCIFRNNKNDSAHGGALFLQGGASSEYHVENSLFINNYTHQNGGAVQVAANAKGVFVNCTFANNVANNQTGGAVGGGGTSNSHFLFINTIAYNNYGNNQRSSYGIGGNINQGGEVISLHSAIESESTKFSDGDDQGHVALSPAVNPGFRLPSSIMGYSSNESEQIEIFNASYELSGGSPCVDTGIDTGLPTGITLPERDLAGKSRIHDGSIDMGAFEYIIDTLFSWLRAPAIFVQDSEVRVVGPGESAAAFTKFHVNGTPVESEGGAISIEELTGEITLKATNEDGSEIIRLVINR